MTGKKRKVAVIVTSILIAGTLSFILINSMLSRDTSAETSGKLFAFLKNAFDAVFGEGVITHAILRKLTHFGEFALLGFEICALYLFLGNFKFIKFLHIAPYGLFVAVLDESIQILSNRGAQVLDVLIDYSGYAFATVTVLVAYTIIYFVKKKKKE